MQVTEGVRICPRLARRRRRDNWMGCGRLAWCRCSRQVPGGQSDGTRPHRAEWPVVCRHSSFLAFILVFEAVKWSVYRRCRPHLQLFCKFEITIRYFKGIFSIYKYLKIVFGNSRAGWTPCMADVPCVTVFGLGSQLLLPTAASCWFTVPEQQWWLTWLSAHHPLRRWWWNYCICLCPWPDLCNCESSQQKGAVSLCFSNTILKSLIYKVTLS